MNTGLEETPLCDVCFYDCAWHALKSKTYRRRQETHNILSIYFLDKSKLDRVIVIM